MSGGGHDPQVETAAAPTVERDGPIGTAPDLPRLPAGFGGAIARTGLGTTLERMGLDERAGVIESLQRTAGNQAVARALVSRAPAGPPATAVKIDYDAICDASGHMAGNDHAPRVMALIRDPAQLDQLYADADGGNKRAATLIADVEEVYADVGTEVAEQNSRLVCALPVTHELLPGCIPNWAEIAYLDASRRGGRRLREAIGTRYAEHARKLGLRNAIIFNALMALGAVAMAARLKGGASGASAAPETTAKPGATAATETPAKPGAATAATETPAKPGAATAATETPAKPAATTAATETPAKPAAPATAEGATAATTGESAAAGKLRQPGEGHPRDARPEAKWGNPKSMPAYGHSQKYHGAKRPAKKFQDDANRTKIPQGQFYDDQAIVEAERRAPLSAGAHDIDMGTPIGRVYQPGAKPVENVTRVRVVREAPDLNVKTSFPIE